MLIGVDVVPELHEHVFVVVAGGDIEAAAGDVIAAAAVAVAKIEAPVLGTRRRVTCGRGTANRC